MTAGALQCPSSGSITLLSLPPMSSPQYLHQERGKRARSVSPQLTPKRQRRDSMESTATVSLSENTEDDIETKWQQGWADFGVWAQDPANWVSIVKLMNVPPVLPDVELTGEELAAAEVREAARRNFYRLAFDSMRAYEQQDILQQERLEEQRAKKREVQEWKGTRHDVLEDNSWSWNQLLGERRRAAGLPVPVAGMPTPSRIPPRHNQRQFTRLSSWVFTEELVD
ncbi:hypothetical protein B0H16DRAFT_1469185 [Mycena metata]|uniref:Uncharacterized protein n=1 Tax=Mycena metata TaxID=1033252 RepID=A0AAD7HZ53_9AGAR|nr:hypothetical protein B0H16DRAFT_1469185 [Mycena metata]